MKRMMALFIASAATFHASVATAARAIVTDPTFTADDSWLYVSVQNAPLWFSNPLPDYAAHRFVNEDAYTHLPASASFWLPKERPYFELELQPSGNSNGNVFRVSLATEITAMAHSVVISNEGPGLATGIPVHFFTYRAYYNGKPNTSRQIVTNPIPEPATATLAACALGPVAAVSRRQRSGRRS